MLEVGDAPGEGSTGSEGERQNETDDTIRSNMRNQRAYASGCSEDLGSDGGQERGQK